MAGEYEVARNRLDECLDSSKTFTENQQMYNNWSKTYDQDHIALKCTGPSKLAEVLAEMFPKGMRNISILDVAAGTGLVGVELHAQGFTSIDALEPNKCMMEEARKKRVYKKEYLEAIPETGHTSIETDSFDVVACRGGFGAGALPLNSVPEMLRMTKPGGYIIILTLPHHFETVPEYKDKMLPLMTSLEDNGQWKKIREEILEDVLISVQGILLIFQKTDQ